MLLSQDEARFPLVPTLHITLGVKGHRPTVGTWDNKNQVYCFAALHLVTGQLTTRLLEQPAHSKATTGHSKQQRLQTADDLVTQLNAALAHAAAGDTIAVPYLTCKPYKNGHMHLRFLRRDLVDKLNQLGADGSLPAEE